MRKPRQMAVYWAAVTLAVATMAVLSLVDFPLRNNVQNLLFDEFQRWRPRVDAEPPPIRVVEIDDESIAKLGRWPWPRARLGEMMRRSPRRARRGRRARHPALRSRRATRTTPRSSRRSKRRAGRARRVLHQRRHAPPISDKAAGFAFAGDDPAPLRLRISAAR